MPCLSSYYPGAPRWQWNGHVQTIAPNLLRRVPAAPYQRERLELPDGDFVDLDWWRSGNRRLAILTHGLEGNSSRAYIVSMARALHQQGWDVLAWNCRSCSGEMNRNLRLYYHGDTYDITQVVNRALQHTYERLTLIGFSMGGSIIMKYLGLLGNQAPGVISHAVAVSSPCDIERGVELLERPDNRFYRSRFLRSLSEKVRQKARRFPDRIDDSLLEQVEVWRDFDEYFSAPLNGFENAAAFYRAASARYYMGGTTTPTLLLNAQNDPILSEEDYPESLCRKHTYLYLETPREGGHLGFALSFRRTWTEERVLAFLEN